MSTHEVPVDPTVAIVPDTDPTAGPVLPSPLGPNLVTPALSSTAPEAGSPGSLGVGDTPSEATFPTGIAKPESPEPIEVTGASERNRQA